MKIAVPWPPNKNNQNRIKDSLNFWENNNNLLLCLINQEQESFLKNYDTCLMPRSGYETGKKTKCFISDMVKATIKNSPNSDWFGFGNSDIVPINDLLEDQKDEEVLIYHRTEIPDWQNRFFSFGHEQINDDVYDQISNLRFQGITDKKIAKNLNIKNIKPPAPDCEWTSSLIQKIFEKQGKIFIWGQDLFLFRKDVVNKVIKEYLEKIDPIIGTGGFDFRLSHWLMQNFKSKRILNKIFHKTHISEWSPEGADFKHNGPELSPKQLLEFYNDDYYLYLRHPKDRPIVPKYFIKKVKNFF